MPASQKGCNKLLRTVEKTVSTYGMLEPKDSVLVGVSGGPDSIALLHVLLKLASRFSLRLGVAHLNHSLRQKDSDKDAEFVASVAEKFDLPCYVRKEDVYKYQVENKLSLEEAARRVRYTFFESVSETNRFNKIALGHHCDDNAELILMNLFRGSGPQGISGIPPMRDGKIIRPLINLKRSEIIDYLDAKELNYVSDSSNWDTKYIRNRIRLHLIPLLKESYNPKIIETLNRLAAIIGSEEEWIEDTIQPLFEKTALSLQDDIVSFSVPRLKEINIAAQRRIIRKAIARIKGDLRRITFSHIDSVINLLESEPTYKNLDFPDRIRVQLNRESLIFSKEKKALRDLNQKSGTVEKIAFEYKIAKPEPIFIKEIFAHMKFSEMDIEDLSDFRRTGQHAGFFDKDALSFPLVLRNIRPGDRFKPMGMTGTQKVTKFFIDKKVPKTERARCPVMLSQGKIVWVVGHRIDESVKVTPSTRNVLKMELFLA